MGAFDLAVELWRARIDVDVANALVFDLPVKLGLELVPAVGSDALHTKTGIAQAHTQRRQWRFSDYGEDRPLGH